MVTPQKRSAGNEGRASTHPAARRRFGLGRMEVVVVIALAVCLFVSLPQFLLHNRQSVRRQQTAYQLRQVSLAVSQYYETHRSFPSAPIQQPNNATRRR